MPFRANKALNGEQVSYTGFSGGLNLAASPEALQPDELAVADNVERDPDAGGLRVRAGLRRVAQFPNGLISFVHNPDTNEIFGKAHGDRQIFGFTPSGPHPGVFQYSEKNAFTATGRPPLPPLSVVSWGGASQGYWDAPVSMLGVEATICRCDSGVGTPTMTELTQSPSGRCVCTWGGRLGVATHDSKLHFSAVGDPLKWTNTPNDLSSAQFINVGYKDGENIQAVIPLGQDLIVFKGSPWYDEGGSIWRVSGFIPNTTVYRIAVGATAPNSQSVCAAGNDVFFLSKAGLCTLSSVMEYGSVKLSWLDAKVSAAMMRSILGDAYDYGGIGMWHIRSRGQLWVPSADGKTVWVFHYKDKMWTRFIFPWRVKYACDLIYTGSDKTSRTFVVLGDGSVCIMDPSQSFDLSAANPIEARLRFPSIVRSRQVLVKGIGALYDNGTAADRMQVRLSAAGGGAVTVSLPPTARSVYVSEDTREAFSNGSPAWGGFASGSARYRCLVRGWGITPEVVMKGNGKSLQRLSLEFAEV